MSTDTSNDGSKVFLWLGVALLAILLFGLPFGHWWGWTDGWGWMGSWIAMMLLMPVVLVILIVVLIVAIATGSNRHQPPPAQPPQQWQPAPSADDALSILEKRYAAGLPL